MVLYQQADWARFEAAAKYGMVTKLTILILRTGSDPDIPVEDAGMAD